MKHASWIIALAIVAIGLGGQAYAFHDGGVADCAGCHSMHSAVSPIETGGELGFLLTEFDQSSTCLYCHESAGDTGPTRYHISTPDAELVNDADVVVQRTPGGDFGWLRQDLSALASYYAPISNDGQTRGHNIVADGNYVADTTNGGLAPGGTMQADKLGCQSCHDPHGNARIDSTGAVVIPTDNAGTYPPITDSGSYGAIAAAGEATGTYRLLGATGYQATNVPAPFPGAPAAVVPEDYNRSEAATPTRVAYGYGTSDNYTSWGLWCATCHPDMHTISAGSPGGQVHPIDKTLGSVAANYNLYVKTGTLNGVDTDSYTSLVPFSSPTTDTTTLLGLTDTEGNVSDGPTSGDRMNCLTCHRAHASGWEYALRWNNEAEFLTLGTQAAPVYPGIDAGLGNQGQFNRGYTIAQMEAAYNDRPAGLEFAGHQRVLCNKCHLKD